MERLGEAKKRDILSVNPLIKRLWSVEEGAETTASYAGIYGKCLFFMCMTLLGVLLAVYFGVSGAISVDPVTDELFVDTAVIWLALVSLVVFIVFPFLAFLLRRTIPVTGSVYCISLGYMFAFLAVLDAEMGSYILLALVLTLAIVAVMGFLYAKGIIRVTEKLRAVSTTLFTAMFLGTVLLILCYFVPFLRDCVQVLLGNPIVSALASVSGMVIAILFLLTDFENMRGIVENRLPRSYEWYASFSLVFTVVWVYLKVLDLVMKAKNHMK